MKSLDKTDTIIIRALIEKYSKSDLIKAIENDRKTLAPKTKRQLQVEVKAATIKMKEKHKDVPLVDLCQSPIEIIFLVALQKYCPGVSVECQFPVGSFFADFKVSKGDLFVMVELDGKDWHTEHKDKIKDDYYRANNMPFVRFTGSEVCSNTRTVINKVMRILDDPANDTLLWTTK